MTTGNTVPSKKNWFLRHKILAGIIIVVIIIVIASVAGNSGSKDSQSASPGTATTPSTSAANGQSLQTNSSSTEPVETTKAKATQESSTAAKIGDPVRDGKFEFTVTSVDCGKDRIGDATFGEDAQGQFCLVRLTAKNIGDEAQTLFGSNQTLYDSDDRKYSADAAAAIYLPDAKTLAEQINPGNQIKGTIVFDVPKSITPAAIELHDSLFSGGVKVSLSK